MGTNEQRSCRSVASARWTDWSSRTTVRLRGSENVDHERNERRERSRSLYLREHTEPLEPKYKTTIELWLTQIMDAERISDNIGPGTSESQNRNEPNDYDSDSRDSN